MEHRLGAVRSDLENGSATEIFADAAVTAAAAARRAVQVAGFVLDQAGRGADAIVSAGEGMEHRLGAVSSELENSAAAVSRTARATAFRGLTIETAGAPGDEPRIGRCTVG